MDYNCYITFPTVFFAIRAEALLRKEDLPFKMVPVPRVISSSCGTALRCECCDLPLIRSILVTGQVEMENFYKIAEKNLKSFTVEELSYD